MGYTGEVSIGIDEIENIDREVFLIDKNPDGTEISYAISDELITLNLEQGTYQDRFFITFSSETLSNDEQLWGSQLEIYVDQDNAELVVGNHTDTRISRLTLYNILRQEIQGMDGSKRSRAKGCKIRSDLTSIAIYHKAYNY